MALYFAVEKYPDRNGKLFALFAPNKANAHVLGTSPFAINYPVKFLPSHVTPRIRAQEGLFVACPDVETPLDDVLSKHALDTPVSKWKLTEVTIKAQKKEELKYLLFRLGVHASSLFPDLGGLCDRLRWQHSINSPF